MSTLLLPGRSPIAAPSVPPIDVELEAILKTLDPQLTVRVLADHPVSAVVGGAALESTRLADALDDDLLELRFDGGITRWTTVAGIREENSVAGDVITVPAVFHGRRNDASGTSEWTVRSLRVLRIVDPGNVIASRAADDIADAFDERTVGLHQLAADGTLASQITDTNPLFASAEPFLIFVHGIASSTRSSFGRLFEWSGWRGLKEQYDDRALALEQKTLSVGPIDNALALATLLPAGAKLHLVTHGQGGFVAELLCLDNFADSALRMFDATRQADATKLRDLRTLLAAKQFNVERFLRVACPARGTVLASRGVDAYFSVLLNVFSAIPAIRDEAPFTAVKGTALALIKKRAQAPELSGLQALLSDSELVQFLHQGLGRTRDDLGIIAGDLQGEGLWRRLKMFGTNVYCAPDHDLVVDTAGMYGAMGRRQGVRYSFERGANVHHYSYFASDSVRLKLRDWLSGDRTGFKLLEPLRRTMNVGGADPDAPKRPRVIVVPDVFGSTLRDTNGSGLDLWLDVQILAQQQLGLLLNPATALGATSLEPTTYDTLVRVLGEQFTVVPFAYDWRQSIADTATALASVFATQTGADRPVHIVTHGAGALVVRFLVANRQQLNVDVAWRNFVKHGGRVVMLAPPNRGMAVAVEWCTPDAELIQMLALADGQLAADVATAVRSWPGMLDLLPDAWLEAAKWTSAFANININPQLLTAAKTRRDALRTVVEPQRFVTVVGQAARTPLEPVIANHMAVPCTTAGDGRVSHASSQLANVTMRTVFAAHGSLPAVAAMSGVITALLNSPRVSETSPVVAATTFIDRIDRSAGVLFPTNRSIAALALDPPRDGGEPQAVLHVSVLHSDIRNAKYPVLVGHYDGDNLVSVEDAVDRQLDRALSRRFHLGVYPGALGTFEIVRKRNGNPPGAIVIGLGLVGGVNAEIVRRGVGDALVHYALSALEESPERPGPLVLGFSAVLIGTKGGNALTTDASINAIVCGALDANRALRRQKLLDRVRISEIEVVELFEQRAIQGVHAAIEVARRLQPELQPGETLHVIPSLQVKEGGRFHTPINEYESGWWRRISIRKVADGSATLQFEVLTDRARTEGRQQCNDPRLNDILLHDAISDTEFNADLSSALFELLIPNEIKDSIGGESDVVLLVDNESAQYPWEILADRTDSIRRPLVTRMGMLRQFFANEEFRRSPRSAQSRDVLVVGDTMTTGDQLPAAQREAEVVSGILSNSFNCTTLVHRPAEEVVTQLFARDYRILHIAGHGDFNDMNPLDSGISLGDGKVLSACQLDQMRVVPDLVFINCCFLATVMETGEMRTMVNQPNRFAASVAETLIRMGVKAVVAAGWAVRDGPALTFASTLYKEMIDRRQPFGEAVRRARVAVFKQDGVTNTWAAYQCYGNPGFMLADDLDDGDGADPECFSIREFIDVFRNIAADARDAEPAPFTARLEGLTGQIEVLTDGEMWSACAGAWQTVGNLANAIDALEHAIADERAAAPMRALELLANLRSRHAVALWTKNGRTIDNTVQELCEKSLAMLNVVAGLERTTERVAVLAETRRALCRIPLANPPNPPLLDVARDYRDLATQRNQLFPRLTAIAIEFVADPTQAPTLIAELNGIEPSIKSAAKIPGAPFLDRIARIDLLVTRHIVKGTLAQRVPALADAYIDVTAGSSTREQQTVFDNLGSLADIARTARPTIAEALDKIVDRIQ
jgi:hypothetical protein